MTAKRPLGVTLAAVAAILGSGLFILMGLGMLLTVFVPSPQPALPLVKAVSVVMCFVLLGVAGWGITTSVGLFRMRGWSRWSILTFSGLLAFMCGSSAVMITVIPFPVSPEVSAQVMDGIKIAISVFYGVLALMGVFWLYYFNTARVRTQFGPGAGTDGPGGRPLSISIIAWLALVGGVFCAVAAFSPWPAMVFGLIFTGWAARVFYLAFAAIEVWIGTGLLRLNPLSRLVAIGMFAYTILNSALFVLLPGYGERVRTMLERFPSPIPAPLGYDPTSSTAAGALLGSLVSIVPIWFLISRRRAFKPQQGPPEGVFLP